MAQGIIAWHVDITCGLSIACDLKLITKLQKSKKMLALFVEQVPQF